MPAKAAFIKLASDAANTALIPIFAISDMRSGIRAPRPPRRIAIELKLANPQRAKVSMTTVLSDN